jgi:hypothetical protein
MSIPLAQQIKCVEIEIKRRERAYPIAVISHKLGKAEADKQLETMKAVLETLRNSQQAEMLFDHSEVRGKTQQRHPAFE